MKGTPIYIKALELEGIKTLNAKISLSLVRKDGSLSQWTVILGDNGIGKSTLLQAIAWMKPSLPYDSKDIPDDFEPAPILNDEQNEVLEKLVSRHHLKDEPSYIRATYIAHQFLGVPLKMKGGQECRTSMTIGVNKQGKLETVEPGFKTTNDKVFFKDEAVIFGYSASRHLGKLNLNDPKLLDTIPGFISENTILYDAEEILHALNYSALGARNQKDVAKYKTFIKRVKEMLVTILPDFQKIDDIDIVPPNVLGNDSEGGVMITTRHGERLPFSDFSLGYKTVVSWTIDLAWRMFNKYHEISPDPLKEPAIVLVDEIDLHLHPFWQREIMFNLSQHFPNVQFIATAHSPLMVQAAIESNYAVLRFEDGKVILLNEPTSLDGWRVDQILTSELFGLESSRGLKYEKLIKQRESLMSKKRMSPKDKADLKKIDKAISELPSGENPDDIENRKVVSDLIEKIKKGGIAIKL
jgi:predicted ATP-binding protein involved in virulence